MRRAAYGLLLICMVALTIGIIVSIYFYSSSSSVRDTVNAVVLQTDTPDKAFPGREGVNVLLMGRDVDRDRHGRVLKTHGRTDTIMFARVDFRNRQASILSIPRDTLVRVPGYRGKRKINSAHALGGPELASDTVSDLLGVRPDYYVAVNFDAFERAIDMIGGLEVTVDKQLDYDDNWGNLHIHLKPGRQTLNGNQAIGFVRYRKSNDGAGDSDLVRIGRQQELIKAARARLVNPQVMFRAPKVLDTIRDEMEGNLTPSQMLCLARFLKSLPADTAIRMETLPSREGGMYVRADLDATRQLVHEMFLESHQ